MTSKPVERLAASRLENVIAEGRRARGAKDFNRFRLMVRAEDAAQEKEKLFRSFEGIPTRDKKTHLHVVEKHECRISSWEPTRRPESWLPVAEERRLTRHVQNRKRVHSSLEPIGSLFNPGAV